MDWGSDGGEDRFDDAKGLSDALTVRGQDGWRLCQYTPALGGWHQGGYVLEHLGPTPHLPRVRRREEEIVAGLSPEELDKLSAQLEGQRGR